MARTENTEAPVQDGRKSWVEWLLKLHVGIRALSLLVSNKYVNAKVQMNWMFGEASNLGFFMSAKVCVSEESEVKFN